MSASDAETATTLAGIVTAVPGVARLYPSGGVLGQVSAALTSAITGAAAGGDIAVGDGRIAIRIGVGPERPAAEVCRDVYAAARSWAAAGGMPDAVIEVTAASVEPA
jgi:hypothetical protein